MMGGYNNPNVQIGEQGTGQGDNLYIRIVICPHYTVLSGRYY